MRSHPEHSRRFVIVAAGLLLLATRAFLFAHDPGLSSANLIVGEGSLDLQLTFNERDLAAVAAITPEEMRAGSAEAQAKLEEVARRAINLRWTDRAENPTSLVSSSDADGNVILRYEFKLEPGADLAFESRLLPQLPFGHRQAFAATDAKGREITRRILSARENQVRISLADLRVPRGSAGRGQFAEFFLLGVRHIITGYDHLLFLFGLLVVCRAPRSALLLITCFTLAHSLTLGLATFGLVELPSRYVEAAIAASIVYVGIENLVRRDGLLRGRWLLTLGFGLVHGLGFATVLRELGIAKQGMTAIVPLVAFNSGVEAGQLAIAAIVLPILWRFRAHPSFIRVGVPACSMVVAAAGAYWLLQRTVLS